MNEVNTKKLLEKYPELYRGTKLPITENLMSFGFEHGDGWMNLLDELSAKIMYIAKLEKQDIPLAVQVKEKYGTLRFYTNWSTDLMDDVISLAEHRSANICELCGKMGRLEGRGWLSVRCSEHSKENKNENTAD